MTTCVRLSAGAVVKAVPVEHPRFPNGKDRTHIVLRDGSMMPTSHGQCRRHHLEASAHSGLWKDVDLITEIRTTLTNSSSFEVIGHLSDAEMTVVERIARICKPSLYVEVK